YAAVLGDPRVEIGLSRASPAQIRGQRQARAPRARPRVALQAVERVANEEVEGHGAGDRVAGKPEPEGLAAAAEGDPLSGAPRPAVEKDLEPPALGDPRNEVEVSGRDSSGRDEDVHFRAGGGEELLEPRFVVGRVGEPARLPSPRLATGVGH